MNGYAPHDPLTLALVAALAVAVMFAGWWLGRAASTHWIREVARLVTIAATATVERLCRGEPAGVRMLAIIAVLLLSMKCVIIVEARRDGMPSLTMPQWIGFAALWPGMRPAPFAASRKKLRGGWPLIARGLAFALSGLTLIGLAWLTWHRGRDVVAVNLACVLATLLLLIGLSLILHFGAFNMLAGIWRLAGVDVRPLFRAPLAALSLDAFWSRRWNLAFSEMISLGIYRPLAQTLGRGGATVAAFIASGMLHELAISVPVRAGYGLPMLYFISQGLLVLIERRLERAGRPVSSWGVWSHVWVIAWVVIPAPILFHQPFLAGAIWPIIGLK